MSSIVGQELKEFFNDTLKKCRFCHVVIVLDSSQPVGKKIVSKYGLYAADFSCAEDFYEEKRKLHERVRQQFPPPRYGIAIGSAESVAGFIRSYPQLQFTGEERA